MAEDTIDMNMDLEGGRKAGEDKETQSVPENQDQSGGEELSLQDTDSDGMETTDDEPQLVIDRSGNENGSIRSIQHLDGMYQKWFLDYASYVILERAVPYVNDGLKPVQRRILHSMRELDDGRYNKVANIIGNTMKYHPHGDASIGDALVQLGQKELKSVAAGTGIMKYDRLLSFMKKNKPFIHATLEDTNPQNAAFARKYIQDIWDSL